MDMVYNIIGVFLAIIIIVAVMLAIDRYYKSDAGQKSKAKSLQAMLNEVREIKRTGKTWALTQSHYTGLRHMLEEEGIDPDS
jgi:predicted membrane protein